MLESEPFFYGSSENRLTPKGQVAIPKRFRAVVPQELREEGFVLVPGEGECVYMYTHRQFGIIRQRVRDIAREENDPEFFRSFMEDAHAVDLDTQGRFVLPGKLRQTANLEDGSVLFIGMDDRIELWSPDKREQTRKDEKEYKERRGINARRIFGM